MSVKCIRLLIALCAGMITLPPGAYALDLGEFIEVKVNKSVRRTGLVRTSPEELRTVEVAPASRNVLPAKAIFPSVSWRPPIKACSKTAWPGTWVMRRADHVVEALRHFNREAVRLAWQIDPGREWPEHRHQCR